MAQLHGNITLSTFCRNPTHCLRRFQRSDCGYKGVSLCILRVVADRLLYLFSGVGVGRSSIKRENPAIIGSWRTRRMARRKRNVSDLPYAASPLSCAAFFFKVQKTEICKEERGGTLCVYFSVLKDRTARMSFACSRSRKSSSMP